MTLGIAHRANKQPTVFIKKSTTTYQCCGAFLLFTLFLLSGCANTRTLPRVPTYTTAAELLHIVSSRYDSLRSLQTRAHITLRIDGIRENRATIRILHQEPDQLRLDIGTFNISIMSAVSNQNVLEVYLPRENNHLVGSPERVLKALTGVNLAYYDLDQAILGLPNLSPLDLPRVTNFVIGQKDVFLELTYPAWKRRLIFDVRFATLLEDHIFDLNDQPISKRLLSGYYQTGGFVLPKHIAIHQGKDLIAIDVKSHQSNVPFTDRDFQMRVPGDVRRHDIE